MKTRLGRQIIWTALVIPGLIFTMGCSKERVEPTSDKSTYEEMDDYYDTKKQQEQEYEITEDGNGPLTGKQGTKIYPDKTKLMYPNGDSVKYPYTVKLVELYTAADFLYWQMPTVSDSKLLTSHGEVRIRAFKDDVELVLRPNASWTVEIPSKGSVSDMKIFYGEDKSSYTNWTSNPEGSFSSTSYGYTGAIEILGWVACSKFISEPSATVQLSFTSESDNLNYAGIFIYFSSLESLVQVYNQTSIPLPSGEQAKIVVTAIDANNQLYSYYKELTIGIENEIKVELDSTNDAQLTTILDAL